MVRMRSLSGERATDDNFGISWQRTSPSNVDECLKTGKPKAFRGRQQPAELRDRVLIGQKFRARIHCTSTRTRDNQNTPISPEVGEQRNREVSFRCIRRSATLIASIGTPCIQRIVDGFCAVLYPPDPQFRQERLDPGIRVAVSQQYGVVSFQLAKGILASETEHRMLVVEPWSLEQLPEEVCVGKA